MKVNILINGVPWFGKYSGYECLGRYFQSGVDVSTTFSPDSRFHRALGKSVSILHNFKFDDIRNDGVWAAYKFLLKSKLNDTSHILYADGNLKVFNEFNKRVKSLVGTIHFPISQWKPERLKNLAHLRNGLILYREELDAFREYVHPNQLTFIRHGVDIDFFKPGPADAVNKKKILFVGSYLRNFDMFHQVYELINREISPDYEYHLIIPSKFRSEPNLVRLAAHPNVFFHEKLSDEELLWYYQTSYLLLMPMNDSGANTAIIQAISTGLPVLTTDVGGIRSYGGGDIFPLVKNNDAVSMVELFHSYCSDEGYRNRVADQERQFAVEYMDWRMIAGQHYDYYRKVRSEN
ncbi:glycosyltransferase family 4 protein [Larkinella soli]|uniref:glycosyltransferase family 4 protein n=1 Tax=Larkinella soli TaxID=1770527 RepID=UPI000FFCB2DE|nr:glycosyltransferase [Larkinella soli]